MCTGLSMTKVSSTRYWGACWPRQSRSGRGELDCCAVSEGCDGSVVCGVERCCGPNLQGPPGQWRRMDTSPIPKPSTCQECIWAQHGMLSRRQGKHHAGCASLRATRYDLPGCPRPAGAGQLPPLTDVLPNGAATRREAHHDQDTVKASMVGKTRSTSSNTCS